MTFKIDNTDIITDFVHKDTLFEIYPDLKNVTTMWACGDNTGGPLGIYNYSLDNSTPVQLGESLSNWKFVDTNYLSTAAIKTDGTLWTWGWNSLGQIGTGEHSPNATILATISPVQTICGGNDWKTVSVGSEHVAAIKTDGTLWMWGGNTESQLGDGTSNHKSSPVQTLAGGSNWLSVSAGVNQTAAIKTDGSLWVWGWNPSGMLGIGTIINASVPTQIAGYDWRQAASGVCNTAAIKTDGSLWIWGFNFYGECGIGESVTTTISFPVQTVCGGNDWKKICMGHMNTAAIKTDGTLWGWGYNFNGVLGDGTDIDKSSPVQTIAGGNDWRDVQYSNYSMSAIKNDGSLWVWGDDMCGQLGTGNTIPISSPVQIVGNGNNWVQAAMGRYQFFAISNNTLISRVNNVTPVHYLLQNIDLDETYVRTSCFSVETGNLLTWGQNYTGQLGYGTNNGHIIPSPVITRSDDWMYVAGMSGFVSAIKTDGTLWSWGSNSNGQLGIGVFGSSTDQSTPIQVYGGGNDWQQVACGYGHTAAIKNDNTLWVWGDDYYGQLGINHTLSFDGYWGLQYGTSIPVQTVAGGTDWVQIACGAYHTAAIKTDGTLWLCGYDNYGQLGDNSYDSKSSPVQTAVGGTNWKYADCGYGHTAAIKTDGTLWLWGKDAYGQLGDGYSNNIPSPVQTICSGTNWKQVSCGYAHTAAIKTDGTLWMWGANWNGQIGQGNGSDGYYSSPIQVTSGGTDWRRVSCQADMVLAIKTDGTLWSWGRGWGWGNSYPGEVISGGAFNHSSPVQIRVGDNNWISATSCGEFAAALHTNETVYTDLHMLSPTTQL
jgi:alpha-tubulin suppressor-like RCC1 family protein